MKAIDVLVRAARLYTRWTQPIAYMARRLVKECADLTGKNLAYGRCLDVGAGVAPYQVDIERNFSIDHYVALDISPSDKTNLVADATHIPLRSGTIDLVVSFDALQCLPDYQAVLEEIVRVLRPDGALILTVPFLYGESDMHDYHRWTLEGIETELKVRGFEVSICRPRGGALFAFACIGVWVAQHILPGHGRSWRGKRDTFSILRGMITMILTLPMLLLAWVGLGIDRVLPKHGLYMGVSIYARKTSSP